MPTPQEELAYLRGSLDAEIEQIMDKLPWYEQVLIVVATAIPVAAVALACGALTAASAGAAIAACVLAILALIGAIIKVFLSYSSAWREADALELKKEQMEQLAAQTG